MDCQFDWCVLWSSVSLGFISSVLASCFTTLIIYFWVKARDKKSFAKAEGEYLGYEPSKHNGRHLDPEPISEAKVTYAGGNRLKISLTHDKGKRTWEGLITMANEHYGTLGFQYVNIPDDEYEFGFKKCIISVKADKIMLIGEAPPRREREVSYGREVLIRK